MPRITYIEADGREVLVDLADGWTVMQTALSNGIEGIDGQCGGSCACATCHCYVEEGGEHLPAPADNELAMLEHVSAERRANSRLACQLKPSVDLRVRLPESQA